MANILFVASIIVLFGLSLLVWNERKRTLLDQVRTWPATTGMIVESHVGYARPKTDETDCLNFCYQYHVNGVSHIGRNLDLFGIVQAATLQEMEAIAQAYPQGAKVKVYYDPADVKVSLLEPDHRVAYSRNRNFACFILAVGLLVVSGLLFV